MTPQEQYEELLRSRAMLKSEMDGGLEDLSGGDADGVVFSGQTSQEDFDKARGQNPNAGKAADAGGTIMSAGMIGGNPAVAGAGLALGTLGKIDDAKRQSEQAKIDAYNKKIMAQRSAIRNFFA